MEFLKPIKVKEYGGQPVTVAQTKFDGYYAEVYVDDHRITVCTKNQKVNIWPKLKHNLNICRQLVSLPNFIILRCELHAFGVPATSVPTLINNADQRLLLSPFCIELWGGIKLSLDFESEKQLLINHGFIVPQVRRLSVGPSPLLGHEVSDLKELAKAGGFEGWVLKDKPCGNSWKIKPQKTVDAFVVKATISDSDSYAGGLKSVDIAVMDGDEISVIATVGTGFEADYRMSVELKSLVGKVGEFKYQSLGAKGRLKFPRFLRWRDDEKSAGQCLMSQLKGGSDVDSR